MQNGIVPWIVPALRYEIFNLGVLTGNKQQLEVFKEGVFSNEQGTCCTDRYDRQLRCYHAGAALQALML